MKKNNSFDLYGIFGYPLTHSLSPRMQEKAFAAIGLKAYYLVFDLPKTECLKLFRQLRKSLLSGFNVTVPYKEDVVRYLDHLTPEAKSAGAVNTVYKRSGKWIGANTDIYGFVHSLEKDARFKIAKKRILVLGAGGAARAVVSGLLTGKAASVTLMNRNFSRARQLEKFFSSRRGKCELMVLRRSKENFQEAFSGVDLVVNATSAGLHPSDPLIVSRDWLPSAAKTPKTLFFDLIYRPAETPFLKIARKKGYRTLNGVGMLVYQGARAFELWTGKRAPKDLMRLELLEQLSQEEKNA